MKFSENWLRTFVNPALSSAELADTLTMAGLEVESRELVAPPFDRVVIGEVLSVEKHPEADRLKVCRVDIGSGAPLQIVCGAGNVACGIKVAVAMVGARLPGIAIERADVRGIESAGMLCSAKELGLSDESNGLLILPQDAPAGADLRVNNELDDSIFTLKLTPNRADCLSLIGVARDVAAITTTSLYLAHG
ncbi:MAG: phenylalanine--tRNA ligase subunit beta, partial [Burkholderiales bacterium]|nr:phenylalanine--tRNA ligase subunit beta [Burkholderiales bacterium]